MVAFAAQTIKENQVGRIRPVGMARRAGFKAGMSDIPLYQPVHQPVLLREAVEQLAVRSGWVCVDATAGEGGHSLALLQASAPSGRVLGIDRDPRSLARAEKRLSQFGDRFIPAQGTYADLGQLAQQANVAQVDGVLLDLGLSSWQLEGAGAGFSFQRDEPLDMRFDPKEDELGKLLFQYGEEPRARTIAQTLVRARQGNPIRTTGQLVKLMEAIPGLRRGRRTHPATRTFQALRIAVNDELTNLEAGLKAAIDLLKPGGRLVVISYHSLEDRLVKQTLAHQAASCVCPPEIPVCVCNHQATVRIINRRIIRPAPEEVAANPRSRSARMRVAEKL
jgi:16S rRNA (cytosine1402-N4)-methyltransferase